MSAPIELLDYDPAWPLKFTAEKKVLLEALCRWLVGPIDDFRTHHLHLIPMNSPLWHARLAFRDTLRRDASTAAQYVALKDRLAAQHRNDREAYTEGKAAFVERIVIL